MQIDTSRDMEANLLNVQLLSRCRGALALLLTRQHYISHSGLQAGAGTRRSAQARVVPLPNTGTQVRRLPEAPNPMIFKDRPRLNTIYIVAGLILTMFILSGCATLSDNYRDPVDPWESYNRSMTRFNDKFDKYVGKPVARVYRNITPAPLDKGITNFFNNFYDITSAFNNLLQLKFEHAVSDIGRVVFNTTLGLFGFFDVASAMDFERHYEDFGQTLGYWGVSPGPYLVLPILGPSDVRDTGGLIVDALTNPVTYVEDNGVRNGLILLRGVDQRADLLGASKILQEAALDPYEFMRDAYLQKRLSDIYDGNPPMQDDEDFPEDDLFQDEDEPSVEDEAPKH